MKARNRQGGQAFILMVLAISFVATSISLFSLARAQKTFQEAVEHRRSIDIMYVLDGVARWLHYMYYYESNCDPYTLSNKVNSLALADPAAAGQYLSPTNRVYLSAFAQQGLDIEGVNYQVSVGAFNPPPSMIQNIGAPLGTAAGAPPAIYKTIPFINGVMGPQDVSVTYWVSPLGAYLGAPMRTRYEQTITLINTCSPVPVPAAGTFYLALIGAQFPTLGNGITNMAAYKGYQPVATVDNSACPTLPGPPGVGVKMDLDGNGHIDVADRGILQNVVKNGDWGGVVSLNTQCLDLNADGVVNEVDLSILEKSLKGYLYYYTPSYQPAQ